MDEVNKTTFCANCGTQKNNELKFCPSCGAQQRADVKAHDNKVTSILAYIIFFIPLLAGAHKESEFIKFHTNQGTVLAIAAVIWSIVYSILSAILIYIPIVGWIAALLLSFVGFLFVALCIIGILNVVNETMKPLPVIGKFTVIK
jgi:uncharacterized membrane protein